MGDFNINQIVFIFMVLGIGIASTLIAINQNLGRIAKVLEEVVRDDKE